MAKARRPKSYVAKLSPWAARLNLRPHLDKVSLSQILSGDTCSPISLSDFERYLTYKEFSVENLQFIVWFQDYRKRFFALSEVEKAHSPGPSEYRSPSSPSRVDLEQRAFHNISQAQSQPCRGRCLLDQHFSTASRPQAAWLGDGPTTLSPLTTSLSPIPASPPPSSPSTPVTPYTPHRVSLVPLLSSSPNPPPFAGTPTDPNKVTSSVPHGDVKTKPPSQPEKCQYRCIHSKQPFRVECMRIVATFFQPGATKELSLDEIVRDTVVRDLVLNTHPDVFLPAYEEVYELVERTSLPRFLAFSTANINRPKQLFWYFCGVLHILGSLAVAITLIRMLPDTPSRNRAWRLFSLPWAWFGSMQLFAASRGFCNQVWSRNGVQLHSWELSESDEESRHFVERVITESEIPCSDEKVPNHDRQTSLRPSSFLRHPPSSMYSQSTLHANTVSSHGHGDVYAPPSLDEPLVSYTAPTLHDGASTLDSKTISLVAPFLNATSDPDSSPHGHKNHTERNDQTTQDDKYDHASKLLRPPIFGPERVVQDHRIKAVHRQTMNAIWLVGLVYVVVFAAIVFAVPSPI